jgi:Uma2 family endonuclease
MERRSMTSWTATRDARFEYERPPRPIFFPEEELVPETKRHLELRTILFTFLKRAFGERAAIGSDQFVYFHAADPRRCVAPDAFVRLDAENDLFPTWKVWERGAPDVAIEIVSDHERSWADKLADYQQLGVRELVRFDPEAPAGVRLRVWDRVHEDLVPRLVAGDRAASRVLGGTWCVAPGDNVDVALRLEDASGVLLPTTAEAERAEREAKEAERAAREAERARADAEREAKEAERARAEAERARADAERQAKEAERAAKEAEREAKEAERARADALEAKLAALLAERGRAES